jgi:hypothetical protein
VKAPSPLFYGFFLAAEWKQKEAFRPFTELLSRPEAMLPNLLSEPVVSEDVASRILAEFYDGDPASLFRLLMDSNASDSIRFWQWRTLIRVAINNEVDHDIFRSLLTRAVDDLEQERNLMVWSGWESVIIYFGLTTSCRSSSAPTPPSACSNERWATSTEIGPMPAPIPSPLRGRSHRVLSWSDGRARLGDREPVTDTSHQR